MSTTGDSSPVQTTASFAAKFGTLIPNRVFVGGLPPNTQEYELKSFFSSFGTVKDCKVIVDRNLKDGISKGSYGFVTFENQEDAEKLIKRETNVDNLMFKDRKLNIGPAIRKAQPMPRLADNSQGQVFLANGHPFTFQHGMTFFDPLAAQSCQTQQINPYFQQAAAAPFYSVIQSPINQAPAAASPTAALWATSAWSPNAAAAATGAPVVPTTGQYYYQIQHVPERVYAQPQAAAPGTALFQELTDVDTTGAEYAYGSQYGAPVC